MLNFPHPQIHPGSLAQLLKNAKRILEILISLHKKNRGKDKSYLYFLEVRRFGLARSRLTAIPCFASMTNRHFAKTLQPQLTRATPKKC